MIRTLLIAVSICVSAFAQNANYPIVVSSTAQLASLNPAGMRAAVVSLTNGPIVFAYDASATDATNASATSPIIKPISFGGRWFGKQVGSGAGGGSGNLLAANNLSDVSSASAALLNLGGLSTNNGTSYSQTLVSPRADSLTVNDDAYAAGWNGSTNVPTKNAVYDQMELKLSSLSLDTIAELNTQITDADIATLTGSETLANKTLTTPTIGSFANANHNHQNSAGGGTLDGAAIASGTIAKARGGFAADNSSGFSVSGTNGSLTGAFTADSGTFTNGVNVGASQNGSITIYGSSSGVGYTITNSNNGSYRESLPASGLSGNYGRNVTSANVTWVSVDSTQTGTHASPSTTNPLSPTWTGPMHTVWYGATGTINLPAASTYAGRAILIYNTGAFTITIDPNGTEVVVRDGTVQTGGVNFTLSSGAGNYVALFCDGTRWITLGYKGTLALGS